MQASVLAVYNFNDKIEPHCDANALGFGAEFYQKKEDRKLHPILYFSKRTAVTETEYHSFELETMAIINPLRRFRMYYQILRYKLALINKNVYPANSQIRTQTRCLVSSSLTERSNKAILIKTAFTNVKL